MATDKEMLDALDRIEGIVSEPGERALALPTAKSLCDQYLKIKKSLLIALPLIDRIPVYGSKIAGAIRFLMAIADTVCKEN